MLTVSSYPNYRHAAAIGQAWLDSQPGDVILIEFQASDYSGEFRTGPGEFAAHSVWLVIRNAVLNNRIVVEAGGNGNCNTEAQGNIDWWWNNWEGRNGPAGAIIVGAGTKDTNHARWTGTPVSVVGSAYGKHVDVQGWGTGVVTLGGNGDAWPSEGNPAFGDPDQKYTKTFGGTSAAAAQVAAACACLQSLSERILCRRLTPSEMREVLVENSQGLSSGAALTWYAPVGHDHLPPAFPDCRWRLETDPPWRPGLTHPKSRPIFSKPIRAVTSGWRAACGPGQFRPAGWVSPRPAPSSLTSMQR